MEARALPYFCGFVCTFAYTGCSCACALNAYRPLMAPAQEHLISASMRWCILKSLFLGTHML